MGRHSQPSRCLHETPLIDMAWSARCTTYRINLQGRFRVFGSRLGTQSALELYALTKLRRSDHWAEQTRAVAGRWIKELLPGVTLLHYPTSLSTLRAKLGVWKRTRWNHWDRQLKSAGQMGLASGLSNQLGGDGIEIERVVLYRHGARELKWVTVARAIKRRRRRLRLLGV